MGVEHTSALRRNKDNILFISIGLIELESKDGSKTNLLIKANCFSLWHGK
jgi:hypothetical protein